MLADLDPLQQRILELALCNLEVEEIAQRVARSGRTVRRAIQQVRDRLESRLSDTVSG